MYVCMWYVYAFETLSAKCIFEILFIIMGQMSYTYIYVGFCLAAGAQNTVPRLETLLREEIELYRAEVIRCDVGNFKVQSAYLENIFALVMKNMQIYCAYNLGKKL